MRNAHPLPLTRLEREHRYLQLLVRAGEILGTALDWHGTIGSVCAAAVDTVADICLLDLNIGGTVDLAAAAHADRKRTAELRQSGEFLTSGSRNVSHPVCAAISSGNPVLVPLVDDAYLRAHSTSEEHEQFMRRLGYRSLMIVPLMTKTQGVVGAMTLVRTDRSEERYDSESLLFAQDLGRRCATAIAKAQLYEQVLNIATTYQKAALPASLPPCEGMTLDAFYEPSSEELLVGGDWYDAFELPDGRIAITVGDVLGHGLEAATWMSKLRSGFRAALFGEPDALRALRIADHMVRAEAQDAFTTAIVAIVDPRHRTLTCASAGHPGPLIWDPTGQIVDPFEERGLPLGLRDLDDVGKTAQTLSLQPGFFAAFFTDGLLEWNRDIDKAWESLKTAIASPEVRLAENSATAVRNAVLNENRHEDDIAILTVRLDKSPA